MKALLVVAALLALTGCTYTCKFDSNARGAKVFVDGAFKGVTPLECEMKDSGSSYTLHLEAEGYHPWTYMITPVQNGTMSFQNSSTSVNTTTNAYAFGRASTANTYGNFNTYGTTQTYATYAWPRSVFVPMVPLEPQRQEQPAPAPVPVRHATTGAFCAQCGKRCEGEAKFCSGCGTRR